MKFKNIFLFVVIFVNSVVADSRHLIPKHLTDEERQQRLEAEAERAAAEENERLAQEAFAIQMQADIVNFVDAPYCNQESIDYILMYLNDKTLWDFWISLEENVEGQMIIVDRLNVIHMVIMYNQKTKLEFLCQQLHRVHKLNLLNVPTQMQNILPITWCMQVKHWDCLIILIKYGADIKNLVIPENIAINPDDLKLCQDAIAQGQKLHHQFLSKKQNQTKKAERKARKKIEKLEQKALEKLEDFSYGIDSDSDY